MLGPEYISFYLILYLPITIEIERETNACVSMLYLGRVFHLWYGSHYSCIQVRTWRMHTHIWTKNSLNFHQRKFPHMIVCSSLLIWLCTMHMLNKLEYIISIHTSIFFMTLIQYTVAPILTPRHKLRLFHHWHHMLSKWTRVSPCSVQV